MKRFMHLLIFAAAFNCLSIQTVNGQIPDAQVKDLWNEAIAESNVQEAALAIKRKRAATLVQVLNMLLDNPEVFDTVEMVDSQKQEISKIQQEYSVGTSKLEKEAETGQLTRAQRDAALLTLKRKTVQDLSEVFLEHQLEVFNELSIHVSGMPRSLTESSAGNIIELTEVEKKAIRKRADELSKEIQEFTTKARKKAYAALYEDLSPERIAKIRNFYGHEQFDKYFSTLTLPKLASDFNYKTEQESVESKMRQTPIRKIAPLQKGK